MVGTGLTLALHRYRGGAESSGPTDATHGGVQRRGAARDRGPTKRSLFRGGPNGLLDITKAHPSQHPPGPDPIPVPVWTLGPTDETLVRRPGSARSEISNSPDGHF